MSSQVNVTKSMTVGIMLSLVLWGIYLAIGATGVFVESSLFDARKSGVVVFFVALFLGLWGIVLKGSWKQPKAMESDGEHVPEKSRPWNPAGLTSVALTTTGVACWIVAVFSWKSSALTATTMLGWGAALLLMGSGTAGVVALSDRANRRGKWLGLVGLLACMVSLMTFVARMTP